VASVSWNVTSQIVFHEHEDYSVNKMLRRSLKWLGGIAELTMDISKLLVKL
jgi:hypothetical protein